MKAEDVRVRLQALAKHIESVVGRSEETQFALLIFATDEEGVKRCEYVSNGRREDVWRAVGEWLMKTNPKPYGDS